MRYERDFLANAESNTQRVQSNGKEHPIVVSYDPPGKTGPCPWPQITPLSSNGNLASCAIYTSRTQLFVQNLITWTPVFFEKKNIKNK